MNPKRFLMRGHYAIPLDLLLDQCEDETKQAGIMLWVMAQCGYGLLDTGEWLQQGLN